MRPMHLALIATLSLPAVALALPGSAHAQNSGRELAQITFSSTDQNGDGVLTVSEVSEMAQNIALSMDTNGDQTLSLPEFLDWDFGFHYLAEQEDTADRYAGVKRIMFALQDLNSDGSIDPTEARITTFWSFDRADLDNDRVLSEDEYLNAWMPILVMKAGRDG